ncbi:hypothetical protein NX059_001700 [Plenodomus lindquistii]|nr:hypothetical protein NX059_001700 [Plenodomus lindquistii]
MSEPKSHDASKSGLASRARNRHSPPSASTPASTNLPASSANRLLSTISLEVPMDIQRQSSPAYNPAAARIGGFDGHVVDDCTNCSIYSPPALSLVYPLQANGNYLNPSGFVQPFVKTLNTPDEDVSMVNLNKPTVLSNFPGSHVWSDAQNTHSTPKNFQACHFEDGSTLRRLSGLASLPSQQTPSPTEGHLKKVTFRRHSRSLTLVHDTFDSNAWTAENPVVFTSEHVAPGLSGDTTGAVASPLKIPRFQIHRRNEMTVSSASEVSMLLPSSSGNPLPTFTFGSSGVVPGTGSVSLESFFDLSNTATSSFHDGYASKVPDSMTQDVAELSESPADDDEAIIAAHDQPGRRISTDSTSTVASESWNPYDSETLVLLAKPTLPPRSDTTNLNIASPPVAVTDITKMSEYVVRERYPLEDCIVAGVEHDTLVYDFAYVSGVPPVRKHVRFASKSEYAPSIRFDWELDADATDIVEGASVNVSEE